MFENHEVDEGRTAEEEPDKAAEGKLEVTFELETDEGPEVGDLANEEDLTLGELAELSEVEG